MFIFVYSKEETKEIFIKIDFVAAWISEKYPQIIRLSEKYLLRRRIILGGQIYRYWQISVRLQPSLAQLANHIKPSFKSYPNTIKPSFKYYLKGCYVYYCIAQFHNLIIIIRHSINWQLQIAISLHPLVGSSPNFKLILIWPNHNLWIFRMKTTSNGGQPLKIKTTQYKSTTSNFII